MYVYIYNIFSAFMYILIKDIHIKEMNDKIFD